MHVAYACSSTLYASVYAPLSSVCIHYKLTQSNCYARIHMFARAHTHVHRLHRGFIKP
jgi:hypothetical protein